MGIKENIEAFKNFLGKGSCRLVAVSKTKPVEDIQEAYDAGQRDFGENKTQELCDKQPQLPTDIRWHMIGHLQRNKVKYIAPFVHLIHSVDSLKLLAEVDKQARKNGRVVDCLLQVHIAEEEAKFGLGQEELLALVKSDKLAQMENVKVTGLMGMATNTDNEVQIRKEFRSLKQLFDQVASTVQLPNLTMKELSMGMSSDYRIAIEEGSTLVRVGSKIFGQRTYH